MKKLVLVAVMAGSLVSGQAFAACNDPRLNATALKALLGGKTVCVPPITQSTMTWQELHVGTSTSTTGDLFDYKRGPPPSPDPTVKVGTWTVTANNAGNNASVIHAYTGGNSYTYTVHGSGVVGTVHSFCVGNTAIDAMVKSTTTGC